MSFTIKQTERYKGTKGSAWWEWAVWIDAPKAELQQVQYVVYTLHPTFNHPVQVIKDRATKFRLKSSGWGEFEVKAALHRKTDVVTLSHWLELHYPASTGSKSGRAPAKSQPTI